MPQNPGTILMSMGPTSLLGCFETDSSESISGLGTPKCSIYIGILDNLGVCAPLNSIKSSVPVDVDWRFSISRPSFFNLASPFIAYIALKKVNRNMKAPQEKVRMIPNPSIKLSLHSESQPLIFKYLQQWKQRGKGSRI